MNPLTRAASQSSIVLLAGLASLGLGSLSSAQAFGLTFTGTSSGEWGMPQNPSASTMLSDQKGGKQNRLEWGVIAQCAQCTPFNNYVQFDGRQFKADSGNLFSLGRLTYRNGSVMDGFDGNFPLNIALMFESPLMSRANFRFLFDIQNTPNTSGDPVADGDRLRFVPTGTLEQVFSVDGVQYALELMGFSQDDGDTLLQEFNSPEGSIAYADLFGQITPMPQSCQAKW